MVFAEREETISGGNFHGEYPAKVIQHLKKEKKFCFCFGFISCLFLSSGLMRSSFVGSGLFGNWCA